MQIPDYRVVILGAGRNVRGALPAALSPIGTEGRLLDWLLSAFAALPEAEIDFVSGYMAQDIMRQYKGIEFHHNPDWERTGPARSLAVAPLASKVATYICYSDVVFRKEMIERMDSVEDDLVIAVDRQWKVRYDGRSESELDDAEKVLLDGEGVKTISKAVSTETAEAEFAGLIRLSGSTAKRLENVLNSTIFGEADGMPEVLAFLLEHGIHSTALDIEGEWAELNAPQDLARFVLGTKAESLERLRPLLNTGQILEVARYTQREFSETPDAVLSSVADEFPDVSVIVRSSSLSEDSWTHSAAGAYLSIPSVDPAKPAELRNAMEQVFASYGDETPENQILVQRMLEDVRMSGVVMTRTHAQGAPYYVLNYDDSTGSTDSVTSGEGEELSTLFLHRSASLPDDTSPDLVRVMETVSELEQLVGHDSLDIEFAVTKEDRVFILQVRPIAITRESLTLHDDTIRDGIREAKRFFESHQAPPPNLVGSFTQLSVMADWNPAEIIGTKPSQLAFSAYRYIITDETWATQRAEYGYRDVRPCNLLVDVMGHPYIDVRATFNSFCPASLPDALAERLIEAQLRKLARHPELHDKVEFDVLSTCWTFDLAESLSEWKDEGFTDAVLDEIRLALRDVTRGAFTRCAEDHAALDEVNTRFEEIRAADVSDLDRAYLHLENARRKGALHFAHLARAGFVAVILLRSAERRGLLSPAELEGFLASLRTVSTDIQEDATAVARGTGDRDAFVAKYAHLRPGTYDVNSRRYGDSPDEFLQPIIDQCERDPVVAGNDSFCWEEGTPERIEAALHEAGFEISFEGFEQFLRQAIEGREYGKFIFTRDLSAGLEALADFGAEHFISREEISHIAVHDLFALRRAGIQNRSQTLKRLAKEGSDAALVHQSVCLPDQIFEPAHLECFQYSKAVPNYVTRKEVRGEVVALDATSDPNVDLRGKIVVIPNADPGFDWIFSREIAGLITMYGGTNSHMAIRMAEFELPGVTGVGELIYEQIRTAKVVELNCAARQIRPLS
ncbi:MAG: hypothetical protein CL931_06420 [Deltaproteobacteria bacterium]|nr:hypothetical protein [Deltaproteobacteria bacterium]